MLKGISPARCILVILGICPLMLGVYSHTIYRKAMSNMPRKWESGHLILHGETVRLERSLNGPRARGTALFHLSCI